MNKSFIALITFVLLALGVSVALLQSTPVEDKPSALVFKNFESTYKNLQSLTVSNAHGVLLDAHFNGEHWLASVEEGMPKYPVSTKHLAELFQTLSQVKVLEAKTSKTKNFAKLGLQALYADDSIATLITLNTSSGSKSLMVGKKSTSGNGSFIRKPSESQSWLADRSIFIPSDSFSWLKQPILPYAVDEVLSIRRVDQDNWSVTRDELSSQLQLEDMPSNARLKYDSILESVVEGLVDLKFQQLVINSDSESTPSFVLETELEVMTTKGEAFRVFVNRAEQQYFISFSNGNNTEYWQNWVYEISTFSAQQLIKVQSDFLASEEAPGAGGNSISSQIPIDEGESPN